LTKTHDRPTIVDSHLAVGSLYICMYRSLIEHSSNISINQQLYGIPRLGLGVDEDWIQG
jgi:hypothetical protein